MELRQIAIHGDQGAPVLSQIPLTVHLTYA